jgi:hypothetical protein
MVDAFYPVKFRYNETMAEQTEKSLYTAVYLGSGTFIIKKPKRKPGKLRQSRLKGTTRGARK